MEKILSINLIENQIVVENNLSQPVSYVMENITFGLPAQISCFRENNAIKCLVFLTCNISNISHYAISIVELNGIKHYLVKSDMII
jgi:hypothetical protein